MDYHDPVDNLTAFVKIRASLDPTAETVMWWTGNIYSIIPDQPSQRLFRFEGYSVARIVPVDEGYQLLTREAAFYQDPGTGQILEQWANPFTKREVTVVHVWNDPVNQQLWRQSPRGAWHIPVTPVGDNQLCWHADILLTYPSPLPRDTYPDHSQSDTYQGAELFQFFVAQSDLENPDLTSVPCAISWTRLGPWLPWMVMGDRPGSLLYQCRGAKLMNGLAELSAPLRSYVEHHAPHYAHAPTSYSHPNETSWSYFKKWLTEQEADE